MPSPVRLNKLSLVSAFVIASSCFQLSQQQRQSGLPFDDLNLNQIEHFAKNIVNAYSGLKHENWLHPGQELVFVTTTPKPPTLRPGQELIFITTTTAKPPVKSAVFVNNKPIVATMVPFQPEAATATPEFIHCLSHCPTTSEFNPICATNRQVYRNEQNFRCARYCGADIEIVRYGSCEGLFPVSRG